MNFIDEKHDVRGFYDLVYNGFEPIFKLAAVLRARDQRTHIKRDDAFVLQAKRNLFFGDQLRKALDDRGFSHARLAEQDRVVFRLAD